MDNKKDNKKAEGNAEDFKKQNATKKVVQERTTEDGKKEYMDEVTNTWVSKNELKKLETKRKKDKDVAEKAAKKSAEPKKESKKKNADEEELDPTKYTENRKNWLQGLRDKGVNPYPHKFHRDMTIPRYREIYEPKNIKAGDFTTEKVALTGRIVTIRASGTKLMFIDIQDDTAKIQVFATADKYEGDFEYLNTLKRGDIVGVKGNPGVTNNGELSIRPTSIEALSYCLHQLPKAKEG